MNPPNVFAAAPASRFLDPLVATRAAIGPALAVAFVLFAGGCDTPTKPNPVPVNRTTTPMPGASPLSDVSGSWKGTISYSYPDDWCACCLPNSSQATATFTQNGATVSGTIHSLCFDEQFSGTLQAGKLAGAATVSSGDIVYSGLAAGPATTNGLYLTTDHLQRNANESVSGYKISLSR